MTTEQHPTTDTTLPTGTWTLDPGRTTVTVAVKKLGFLNVAADLALVNGTIIIDANGQIASVDAAVDAASYASGNPKRDTHVHSDDFLDAELHPTIGFTASRVDAGAAGYQVTGDLALKGKTTRITLDVDQLVVDGSNATFTARTAVDRGEIGVDKLPAMIIGNTLDLTISAQATLAPANGTA